MAKKIDEITISKYMATLGISREEAIELAKFDAGDAECEEVEELTAKAKENIKEYVVSGQRKAVAREYKVNEDKMHLLECLMRGLDHITTIDSITHDSSFEFNFNGENYTVKLIQHRKKK